MARRDGTGPMGMGSNTGRGMGFCNVTNGLGVNRGLGMGIGCRGGFGWNSFNNTMSPVNQSDLLSEEKAILENRLNLINNQLNTTQDDN
ncbi:DUF5320 domain-containing protein [Clostridium sp.]|uniref:DUF5320 domain-containing protein n=1 Tax=Clostridium sp. TaxID=1506 RepID=UPI001A40A58B|nr:DUF5320 domain-containing protein [Clostridium sp.]MBK5241216.1 DUF5320 domain-containing protein [Clostridium sp.]